jgi:hypothetical protein
MSTLSTFRDVISAWPTRAAMQRDLFAETGKAAPVREWHKRNRIPSSWFDAVIAVAAQRGFEGVTYKVLTDLYKNGATPVVEDII